MKFEYKGEGVLNGKLYQFSDEFYEGKIEIPNDANDTTGLIVSGVFRKKDASIQPSIKIVGGKPMLKWNILALISIEELDDCISLLNNCKASIIELEKFILSNRNIV